MGVLRRFRSIGGKEYLFSLWARLCGDFYFGGKILSVTGVPWRRFGGLDNSGLRFLLFLYYSLIYTIGQFCKWVTFIPDTLGPRKDGHFWTVLAALEIYFWE